MSTEEKASSSSKIEDIQTSPTLQEPKFQTIGTITEFENLRTEDEEKHFWEITKNFKYAMLITRDSKSHICGRPMVVTLYDQLHGEIWFISQEAKAREAINHDIENVDQNVGVCFQAEKTFVSVSGKANVVRDKAAIEELWSESWRIWFPDGKESQDLAAIQVLILWAEFWDYSGIAKQFKFLTEAGRAWIESRPVDSSKFTDHAKIKKVPMTIPTSPPHCPASTPPSSIPATTDESINR